MSNFLNSIKMKKIIFFLGLFIMSCAYMSCTIDDNYDLSEYQMTTDDQATGGEDGQIIPPPPPAWP